MCWQVYLIWQKKKAIENRDKSKITKYLTFPIVFVQGRHFTFFYKFDKFEIYLWACFKWQYSFLVY